ncbi:serine/threonine-protein kinase Nek6-like [Oryza brachyantha]|uniref:serine/threonine-protein kinase Nek6-like n=1 Tax=Oryza brachyantha TaxID=4533 RepID=UPI001ADB847B|nr:serine/threonine-protein kinase Nek6-like [Oryza brachyantha]
MEDLASTSVGTPNYMCLEILPDIPYGYKSDVCSLGCRMFELLPHRPAFKAADMASLVNKINRSSISPLKQIVKSMLRTNPEHRPTIWRIRRVPSHIQRRIVTTLSRKVRIPGMSCASCVVTALPGVARAVSDPFSCSLALARLVCPCGVVAPPAFVLCL